MISVSGPGSWPGLDPLEAQLAIFGDLADTPQGVAGLPFVPHLPERGIGADEVGAASVLLTDVPTELGAHGWKLTDHPGSDSARAREFARADLEALSIAGSGYAGPLTISVLGPWTLAATLYLSRGDRVLSDRGAVRDLTQSLTHGVVARMAEITRALPGAELTVQVDERLLGQIQAGVLPTFSGYSRLRAVRAPDLIEGLEVMLADIRAAGARTVVHVGSAWLGIPTGVLAGADAIGLDMGPWNEKAWEVIARAIERGADLWAGLAPAQISGCRGPLVQPLIDAIAVPWRRIGLPLADLDRLTVVPARPGAPRAAPGKPGSLAAGGGLAGARSDLATLVRVGRSLADLAHG